jgi:hypothetical protein
MAHSVKNQRKVSGVRFQVSAGAEDGEVVDLRIKAKGQRIKVLVPKLISLIIAVFFCFNLLPFSFNLLPD